MNLRIKYVGNTWQFGNKSYNFLEFNGNIFAETISKKFYEFTLSSLSS